MEELKIELHTLRKDHLKCTHIQFSAFKEAQLEAKNNSDVVTIHINWSQNAKLRQVREEKGAHYHEHQVSIHAIYSWEHDKEQSHVALSNCTSHNATAVFACIEPILIDFVGSRIKRINIVSDSPSSQYCNKSIFWYLKEFSEKHNTSLKWIYLEHDHGMGILDGIGAVFKRSIKDIIASNPDVPIYDSQQLFERLPEITPSIPYHLYSEDQVNLKAKQLPNCPIVQSSKSAKLPIKDVSSCEGREFSLQQTAVNTTEINKSECFE